MRLFLLYTCLNIVAIPAAITSEHETASSIQKSSFYKANSELGFPSIQFFDTGSLGFHTQNFAIQRGLDNRIYAQNRTGLLVYDGIKWDSITPHTTTLNREFALDQNNRVYTAKDDQLGYYLGQAEGGWQFISLPSKEELPSLGRISNVKVSEHKVVYLIGNDLFGYHPEKGTRWINMDSIKPKALMLVGSDFLITTQDKKLYKYDPIEQKIKEIPIDLKQINSDIRLGATTKSKNIIFASDDGVYLFNKAKLKLKRIDSGLEEWLSDNQLRALFVLSDGRILLGSKRKGIAILDENGIAIRFLSRDNGLKENWVSGIVEDYNKDIWLSHGSAGISRVELDNVSFFKEELGAEQIQSIIRYNDHLFIGSMTNGLSYLKTADTTIGQSQFESIGNFSSVWSLMSHEDGLFVGHTSGITIVTQTSEGHWLTSRLIGAPTVYEVFQSTHIPNVIFGATSSGLLKIEKVDGQWQSQGLLSGFSQALVTMTEDRFGHLWLTSHSGVITRVDNLPNWPNSSFKRYQLPELNDRNNTLMSFDGDIYIGNKSGFYGSDKAGNILQPLETKTWPKLSNGVFHRHFEATKDSNANTNFAISTNGKRLFKLHKTKPGKIEFDDSLFLDLRSNGLYAVFSDESKVLWAGGRNGLMRVASNYISPTQELKKPSIHKISSLHSGKVYFSSANFGNTQIKQALMPQEDELSFQFGTFDFRKNNKLTYRYRMRGLINNWSKWSRDTRADITNLPPGDFDFEIQSKNDLGAESNIAHFQFTRLPYWYQTIEFYFFSGFIGLLLVIILVVSWAKIRTKQLESRARALEEKVKQRTDVIALQSKELERLNKARTRFFTHVSHELRTPLTLTISPLQELLNGQYGKISNTVKQAMGLVLRSASSMQHLLNQVLDLSRLESGALSLKLESINLVDELKRCSEPFELLAKRQSITFIESYEKPGGNIDMDKRGLQSIVNNLLSNAFKFTPSKGEIKLILKVEEYQLSIEVSDTGCGILPDEMPYVFDQYYQAESKNIKPHSGTGIGLSMAREYVELHGGEIIVSSELDLGSTFKVTLPVVYSELMSLRAPAAAVQPEPIEVFPAIQPKVISPKTDDSPTILIVEDNDELRQFVVHRLSNRYHVLEAENGLIGLDICQKQLPDVIITDVMMPEMDGHDLCKALKSSEETDYIPLVMLTSKGTGEEIVAGINLGADDYLAKPFSVPELLARINRLIESRTILRARYSQCEGTPAKDKSTVPIIDKNAEFLEKIRTVVLAQEADGFGVKELAGALAMDRTTLYRKLKNATGASATDAIRIIRLEEAARLFEAQQGSVTEVAYGVGFKSLGHFSRSFTAHFGRTPVTYKTQKNS